jgi:predicted Zn-ribbon and HTH transcriptional regulator
VACVLLQVSCQLRERGGQAHQILRLGGTARSEAEEEEEEEEEEEQKLHGVSKRLRRNGKQLAKDAANYEECGNTAETA